MIHEVNNIVEWYQENKRILPWRTNQDPYHIWISEIMLQQTRIEAVLGYYDRFLKKIPTIKDLAEIDDDELLKLWEGLGYYSRARNLKKAANLIMEQYQGVFPRTFKEMLSLPGIGEYTASAIASICFNEKVPTIDGNVLRVWVRVYNDFGNIDLSIIKKKIRDHITRLMPDKAGDFNEALMEIGEVICLPNGTPNCNDCPLKTICLAKKNNNWNKLPVRKERIKKKELQYTVFIIRCHDEYAISKRNNQNILKGMWEFPNVQEYLTLENIQKYFYEKKVYPLKITYIMNYKHIFTHQIWDMKAFYIELDQKIEGYKWETIDHILNKYAFPSAFQPFLKEISLHNFA